MKGGRGRGRCVTTGVNKPMEHPAVVVCVWGRRGGGEGVGKGCAEAVLGGAATAAAASNLGYCTATNVPLQVATSIGSWLLHCSTFPVQILQKILQREFDAVQQPR